MWLWTSNYSFANICIQLMGYLDHPRLIHWARVRSGRVVGAFPIYWVDVCLMLNQANEGFLGRSTQKDLGPKNVE